MYHSTLGSSVITKKKKKLGLLLRQQPLDLLPERSGVRDQGLEFRIQGVWFRVSRSPGFRVCDSEILDLSISCLRVQG